MSSNTSGVVGGTPFTDSSPASGSASGGATAVDIVESDRKFAALRAKKAAERARAEHAQTPEPKKQP